MKAYQTNEYAGNFEIELEDLKTKNSKVQTMRNKTIVHDINRETEFGNHNDTKVDDYATLETQKK